MRKIGAVLPIGLVLGCPAMTMPARGDSGHKAEYSRTECVYATGAPTVSTSQEGRVVHYKDFPYIGVLTDSAGAQTGKNVGEVEIELDQEAGTGFIRGTMAVRDDVLGHFDGTFEGRYQDFVWRGNGAAVGVDNDTGKGLEVKLQAFPKEQCPDHGPYGEAIDGAYWTVTVRSQPV